MIGRNLLVLGAVALLLAALIGGLWLAGGYGPIGGAGDEPKSNGSGPDLPRALAPVGLEIGSDEGPGPYRLKVGERLGLRAAVELEDGSVRHDAPIGWSSTDPQIATIDADGWLRALAAGQVRVAAELPPLNAEVAVLIVE